jgi:malate dehydrogenase (oxaloacetate-decarboxylating)(NADP+)
MEDVRIVMNGAGAAAQAVMKLAIDYGFKAENCVMVDTRGVIYKGRARGMNPYKERFQTERTDIKTLEDAFKGADVCIGLS